jgi:hypothetical protein
MVIRPVLLVLVTQTKLHAIRPSPILTDGRVKCIAPTTLHMVDPLVLAMEMAQRELVAIPTRIVKTHAMVLFVERLGKCAFKT